MYHSEEGAGSAPYRTLIRLPSFERSARNLLADEDERRLDNTLSQNPRAGAVIVGTGGVRKLRLARAQRGKSGGARVIYYYHVPEERVFLLLVYAKGTKQNLTGAEKAQMRKLTTLLKAEA